MGRASAYTRKVQSGSVFRLIAVMPTEEIERLDEWGVSAEMPSRTAAVRHLIRKGLEAIASETAVGEARKA